MSAPTIEQLGINVIADALDHIEPQMNDGAIEGIAMTATGLSARLSADGRPRVWLPGDNDTYHHAVRHILTECAGSNAVLYIRNDPSWGIIEELVRRNPQGTAIRASVDFPEKPDMDLDPHAYVKALLAEVERRGGRLETVNEEAVRVEDAAKKRPQFPPRPSPAPLTWHDPWLTN